MGKVFISYVREDEKLVDRLVAHLQFNGVEVWVDTHDLIPGERWKSAIRRAIRQGAFFIACFSANHALRKRTYMNEELALAVEEFRLRRQDHAWFIPVRLTRCELPDIAIGPGGETLAELHALDLFVDWAEGCDRLLRAVRPDGPRRYAEQAATSPEMLIGDKQGESSLERPGAASLMGNPPLGRVARVMSRIVRDPSVSAQIKKIYGFRCQVCGIRVIGPSGPYAEAAHVRPLGARHGGTDTAGNMLCLCPNHHYMFDVGMFGVRDDYSLIGLQGQLRVDARHVLNPRHLRYRRKNFELSG